MASTAVDQLLTEVAQEVDALPPIARRELAPVLVQARKETAKGLRGWLDNVRDADTRFTAQQHRNVLAQLDQALTTIANLEPAALRGLMLADRRAGPLAVHHIGRELDAFSKHFGGSVRHVPLQQALTVVQHDRTLMKRFATSAARYAGDVGKDIRRQIGVGLVKGESVREMAQRLVGHGGPRGLVALQGIKGQPGAVTEYIAEGLFARYEWWADRLVRTEVVNAYNVHVDQGLRVAHEADQRIERKWSAVLDRRGCPICRDLDERTAPIGGVFSGGYSAPPAHPNCRCTVVAWRSDWK